MSAKGASRVDPDTVRQLDPKGRFLATVLGKLTDNSLRRSRGLTVVDQFWRRHLLDRGSEGSDPSLALLVHQSEVARLAKKDCLELVELDVRDEPTVTHIGCKCPLQCHDARPRGVPL